MNPIVPAYPLFPKEKHTHHNIHLGSKHRPSYLGSYQSSYPQARPMNPYQSTINTTPNPLTKSQTRLPSTSVAPILRSQPILLGQSQFTVPRATPTFVQPQSVYFGQSQIAQPLMHQSQTQPLVYQPTVLGQSQFITPRATPSLIQPQSAYFGQSQIAPPLMGQSQTQPLASQSQVVRSQLIQSGPAVKGENTIVEYVPFERAYIEQVEVERVEMVPVERRYTDYYAIENQVEYVPVSTFETIREMVPQQKTNYVAQEKVNYIPQIKTDLLTVSRVQETTEYMTQEKHVIKYPEYEGQYISDAENSGRIKSDALHSSNGVAQSWVQQPPMGANIGNQQFYNLASPSIKSPASVQEKYLLKKLEKDIKRLEAETKIERSHSASPGAKKLKTTGKKEVQHLEPDVLPSDVLGSDILRSEVLQPEGLQVEADVSMEDKKADLEGSV